LRFGASFKWEEGCQLSSGVCLDRPLARLVGKRDSQLYGVDYQESSLVAKMTFVLISFVASLH